MAATGGTEQRGASKKHEHEHDIVIRNGTVIDGTGSVPRTADVAIDDGTITAVGDVTGMGAEEIDARGLTVAPGWVDVHTHYDGQASWDPYLTPSSWHGVTTAVMGNCGVGFAPVRPGKHEWLVDLMVGVEDIPAKTLQEGISWGWESFPQYLDVLGSIPRILDIGSQVPHAALRAYVMGERGADHTEEPTADEIAEMGRLAAEAVQAGALGFSTSRTVAHRSADGRPTPTLTASEAELVGIARAIGATGKGVFEMITDMVDLEVDFALFRAMSEVSGRPLSISTAQRVGFPADEYLRVLERLESAVADGIELRGQVAPRPVCIILNLEGSGNPLLPSTTYQSLAALPLADRVVELRRSEVRARILEELAALPPGKGILDRYALAFPLGDPPRYDLPPEESIGAEAARQGVAAVELAYDLLLADEGRGMILVPASNYLEGNLDAVRDMIVHPLTVPGLGDAGAHCTMVCDASFPTHFLAYWGLEAKADQRLPLEWIVKRQSADPAALMGMHDRGVLAPGYRADVNVIDLDGLGIGKLEMRYDLPAGGKRLVQRGTGYVTTIVKGEVVSRDGEFTGALPGGVVRGPQARV